MGRIRDVYLAGKPKSDPVEDPGERLQRMLAECGVTESSADIIRDIRDGYLDGRGSADLVDGSRPYKP